MGSRAESLADKFEQGVDCRLRAGAERRAARAHGSAGARGRGIGERAAADRRRRAHRPCAWAHEEPAVLRRAGGASTLRGPGPKGTKYEVRGAKYELRRCSGIAELVRV